MRWQTGDRSNIEDQRGSGVRGAVPIGVGGLVLLLALSWATGTDFLSLLGGGEPGQSADRSAEFKTSPEEERMVDFVDAVMADAQDAWQQILGGRYQRTRVVLFRDVTQSACGGADAATGPFYCPGDQKVYLDLGFFSELSRRFGAPGDFAQAYVVAHELGHHVQQLLGISERVERDRRSGARSASVALELQADCFAGVWGYAASQRGRLGAGRVELEPGDAEEALQAAAAIGDDRLQKMATGRVQPERFTHGTSAQRVQWFRRGMETGDPNGCDTFSALTH
jgi:predicted metalloprotease